MPTLPIADCIALAARALRRAGAGKAMAEATARALVAADCEGLSGHGLSRVALYAQHLREGRADGKARPKLLRRAGATALIDAGGGLAFTAAALALMVEALCVALTGAALSVENDSYFEPGNKPRIGHALIVIDPAPLAGAAVYAARIEDLVSGMLGDPGVRLPGARRQQAAAKAQDEGLQVPEALYRELLQLARP